MGKGGISMKQPLSSSALGSAGGENLRGGGMHREYSISHLIKRNLNVPKEEASIYSADVANVDNSIYGLRQQRKSKKFRDGGLDNNSLSTSSCHGTSFENSLPSIKLSFNGKETWKGVRKQTKDNWKVKDLPKESPPPSPEQPVKTVVRRSRRSMRDDSLEQTTWHGQRTEAFGMASWHGSNLDFPKSVTSKQTTKSAPTTKQRRRRRSSLRGGGEDESIYGASVATSRTTKSDYLTQSVHGDGPYANVRKSSSSQRPKSRNSIYQQGTNRNVALSAHFSNEDLGLSKAKKSSDQMSRNCQSLHSGESFWDSSDDDESFGEADSFGGDDSPEFGGDNIEKESKATTKDTKSNERHSSKRRSRSKDRGSLKSSRSKSRDGKKSSSKDVTSSAPKHSRRSSCPPQGRNKSEPDGLTLKEPYKSDTKSGDAAKEASRVSKKELRRSKSFSSTSSGTGSKRRLKAPTTDAGVATNKDHERRKSSRSLDLSTVSETSRSRSKSRPKTSDQERAKSSRSLDLSTVSETSRSRSKTRSKSSDREPKRRSRTKSHSPDLASSIDRPKSRRSRSRTRSRSLDRATLDVDDTKLKRKNSKSSSSKNRISRSTSQLSCDLKEDTGASKSEDRGRRNSKSRSKSMREVLDAQKSKPPTNTTDDNSMFGASSILQFNDSYNWDAKLVKRPSLDMQRAIQETMASANRQAARQRRTSSFMQKAGRRKSKEIGESTIRKPQSQKIDTTAKLKVVLPEKKPQSIAILEGLPEPEVEASSDDPQKKSGRWKALKKANDFIRHNKHKNSSKGGKHAPRKPSRNERDTREASGKTKQQPSKDVAPKDQDKEAGVESKPKSRRIKYVTKSKVEEQERQREIEEAKRHKARSRWGALKKANSLISITKKKMKRTPSESKTASTTEDGQHLEDVPEDDELADPGPAESYVLKLPPMEHTGISPLSVATKLVEVPKQSRKKVRSTPKL